MGSISKNFNYSEFEYTAQVDLREKNILPNDGVRGNIKALVDSVLQPLRDALGKPLNISSGYRCRELNERVGGAANSQHLSGSAADVYVANQPPYLVAFTAKKLGLPFDQMILYQTFVHLSHSNGGAQRGQILYDKYYTGERL